MNVYELTIKSNNSEIVNCFKNYKKMILIN